MKEGEGRCGGGRVEQRRRRAVEKERSRNGRRRGDADAPYQVSRIKERVEEKEGIPPAQQRLIYGGKQM